MKIFHKKKEMTYNKTKYKHNRAIMIVHRDKILLCYVKF